MIQNIVHIRSAVKFKNLFSWALFSICFIPCLLHTIDKVASSFNVQETPYTFYLLFLLQSSASLDSSDDTSGAGFKSRMAWSPSVGAVEPSDTESIESRESVKSRDTSPSHSPTLEQKPFQNYVIQEVCSQ